MGTLGRRGQLALVLIGLPALVAVVAMALSRFIDAPILLWNVAWTAGAVSALAGTVFGRSRALAAHRFRWTMWSVTAACWLFGQLAWDFYGAHVPPSPNLGDAGWWGFALCAMVGVMRSPMRSRSLRRVAFVETLPLIAAALAFVCAEMWHDVQHSLLPVASRVAILGYPALCVAATIVTLQALLGGWLRGESSIPARLILVGIAIQGVTFPFWSEQLLDQTYRQGHSWCDPMFVLGMLAMAAGGAYCARAPDRAPAVKQHDGRGGVLPGLVFALLSAALLHAQFTHAALPARAALAVGVVVCGGGLMLRSHLLSLRLRALLERERGAVADLAERESELARINERLAQDARHDALTGMRNRRALEYDLPRLESRHLDRGDAFAIAVCDVDHFKAYNDRLGHVAGDHALQELSAIVRTELRERDLGYRFGGEELLIVLPNTRAGEATRAAERVRAAVEAAALPHPDGIDGILTVSVGVASGCEPASTLLARADAALYDAKRSGRNRVGASTADEQPDAATHRRRSSDDESVPRQLRSMLAVSRAAASGMGVLPVVQALAEMVRLELSYNVVAVNLRDLSRDTLEVVLVLGDEAARTALLGTVNPWAEFDAIIRPENERCGAIWVPAGSHELGGLQTWDPAIDIEEDARAWHPEDMLLLPLRGSDGDVLGVVSVDRPMSGRRPSDGDLSVLMAVADHAGLALERAQRESRQEEVMREQSAELRLAALMLLAETLDLRDPGTGRHSRTVGMYARRTALALGLPADRVERIHAAGVVHDLGKLGIADAILYKPIALDDHEWREMKRHPETGARILEHAGLHDIAGWVRSHHERLDGRGYPDALTESDIPVEARILAVADAFEAMVADRPYRQGMTAEDATTELLRCAGTQFDPAVVDAFLAGLAAATDSDVDEPVVMADPAPAVSVDLSCHLEEGRGTPTSLPAAV
jgi:diguanylate cyclase (GGDEF)-like protein